MRSRSRERQESPAAGSRGSTPQVRLADGQRDATPGHTCGGARVGMVRIARAYTSYGWHTIFRKEENARH